VTVPATVIIRAATKADLPALGRLAVLLVRLQASSRLGKADTARRCIAHVVCGLS
jgi:hypothetical protein